MTDIVFILGAGASKDGGAPVMREFLRRARELLESGELKHSRDSFKRVMEGISALRAAHSNCQDIDIENVESVFAAFEMAQTLGKLPDHTNDEIEQFPRAMKVVIAATIEMSLRFPVEGSFMTGQRIHSPVPYDDFAGLGSV